MNNNIVKLCVVRNTEFQTTFIIFILIIANKNSV